LPSRGILPGRPIVIDLEDNDDAPPAYSSSPTPLRPQPRRLGAASISTIIGRYTAEEARTNLVGGASIHLFHPRTSLTHFAHSRS
jgi:hypothetical protein